MKLVLKTITTIVAFIYHLLHIREKHIYVAENLENFLLNLY